MKSAPNDTAPDTLHLSPSGRRGVRAPGQAVRLGSPRGRPAGPHPRPPGGQVHPTATWCTTRVPPTLFRPQDDATTMSQPQPRGRCPLLKLCPMGSLGEAGGPVISHQKQVWTSPHQGTGAPRRPPQQDFNLGRTGKKFSFSFFFFLPHQDVAYPKSVNIVRTFSDGGGSCRDAPVGKPCPQEAT